MRNELSASSPVPSSPQDHTRAALLAVAVVVTLAVTTHYTGVPVDALAAAFVAVLRALLTPQS